MKKSFMFFPLFLLFSSFEESQLNIVRNGIMALDIATSEYEMNITELAQAGAISSHVFNESTKIIEGSREVIQKANEVLAQIKTLDPETRSNLFFLLEPVANALSTMDWINSIGDPNTQKAVRVGILALRASIHGLQLYLLFS